MKKRIRDACSLAFRSGLLLALPIVAIWADSFTTLTGRVIDPSGRVVPGAQILVRNLATLSLSWRNGVDGPARRRAEIKKGIPSQQVNR